MSTVLAHGCFDLLHLGHIKHLQAARQLGDRLVVSVTGDEHVNKGVGRPHFTAEQRAAALRALACVDQVIVNPGPDATSVIAEVKPAVYVKGVDYKETDGLGLAREKAAVEAVGGKLAFTDTEKISSSRLINAERFPPRTLEYLEWCKAARYRDAILAAFEEADKLKVAFVGEVIIDEYRYVQALGRASKELMLATVETGVETFEGGSIAASKHAEWARGEWIAPLGGYIKKTRFVDGDFNRKLFDVYSDRQVKLSSEHRATMLNWHRSMVDEFDVVVVMDFGHGMFGEAEREVLAASKFLAVNAQTNAGNYGFNLITKYPVADFICIDDPEARLATGMQDDAIEDVVANGLARRISCDRFLVTHGKHGSCYRDMGLFGSAPAFVSNGVDTMGAGDAVMAVTAPLVAAGLPLQMAAFVGNIAGAIKTSIVGHRRHVSRQEIISTMEALLA